MSAGIRPNCLIVQRSMLGGALRFTEYDYFQEQIVKFIVMKRSGAASTGRDREFTDWHALAGFVDEPLEAAT